MLSAGGDKRLGQFSFLGANPFLVIKSKGRNITIIRNGKTIRKQGDPFEELRRLLSAYAVKPGRYPVPFTGGAVGYFGYGLKRFIEKLPHRAKDDINLPDMFFGFYDEFIAIDHLTNKTWQVTLGNAECGMRNAEYRAPLSHIAYPTSHIAHLASRIHKLASNFTKPQYLKAVRKVIDYIFAGDIYQANLSQRFQTNYTGSPLELYKRLLQVNPAPFSAFLQPSDKEAIISSSPERFIKVTGDVIETRPIKGTRPRGRTPFQDRRLKQELYRSAKDNAELSMIVDLERNDVGKVCVYNSVRVTDRKVIETYPTVHHLVSTITGRLDRRYDAIDVIKATFPGGSITGAPKVRAMEIIDELEPTARNAYTGAIGYIGFDGNLDLSIAIRIFMLQRQKLYFQAGGGIVADSDPESEYRETLDKAKGLVNALFTAKTQRAQRI
jgi:para-aminobenzoate synthetase component 1